MESALPDPHLKAVTGASLDPDELPAEVYVISALVQSGQYTPEQYGITPEHFLAHKQVNEFLRLYQRQAKAAPPLTLLLDKFPRFPYVPGVSAVWATKQLHVAFQDRVIVRSLAKTGMLLNEGRTDDALGVMRDALKKASSKADSAIRTVSAYQRIIRNTDAVEDMVPVIPGSLTRYCRGVGPGHLWYVGGIPGMGKSYRLMEHAVLAVEAGWDVDFYNLEMNDEEVTERLQRMLMSGTGLEYGTDAFYDALAERVTEYGDLRIHSGAINTADIEANTAEHTLILIDYVSKVRALDGTRSVTDYRIAASISAELKDITTNCRVPIISAVQFNREAYEAKNVSMKHTSDTDSYNKDPDVFVGMKKVSETVILNTIIKNRHDVAGRKFYTRFAPDTSRAVELSFDEAHEAIYEDTERSLTH